MSRIYPQCYLAATPTGMSCHGPCNHADFGLTINPSDLWTCVGETLRIRHRMPDRGLSDILRRRSSTVSIMPAAGGRVEETSRLIQPARSAPSDEEQLQAKDLAWTDDAIRTAVLATAFLILFTFADVTRYLSTVRLVELGICREYYLENDPGLIDGAGGIPEHLCKLPGMQQRLAHLRGYLSALEAIVGLLLTLPYGLVVNRLGRGYLPESTSSAICSLAHRSSPHVPTGPSSLSGRL